MKIISGLFATFVLMIAPIGTPASAANPALKALIDGVDNGSDGPELILSELSVDVEQHGTMAQFRIAARITNPSDDEVEARFAMQLPRHAVVTGYALDISGVMIPGSLIDQPKAKQIYEDEVRGNIDPGLAEISSGNEFTTRIYPVAAEGGRRISLTFVTPVDSIDGLSIPLETAGPVGVFRLSAAIGGVREAPTLSVGDGEPIAFKRSGRTWEISDYQLSDEPLSGTLKLSGIVPDSKAMATVHSSGRTFFTITDQIAGATLTQAAPERVRIYWDTSRSRADALLKQERALIGRFLEEVGPDQIDVVRFASAGPDEASFSGTQLSKLDAYLGSSVLRGATSFAGLNALDQTDADLCVMFSDGGVSLNHTATFDPDCPLIIIASGANLDAARLGRIAGQNGGTVLYLEEDNADQIIDQMKQLPVAVVDVRDAGGNRLNFHALPAANGHWSITGELEGWNELTVRLSGTERGNRRQIYTVDRNRSARGDAAGALWASREVALLSEDPSDRRAMQRLARRFQVASPTMAFLVLEQPSQYLAADIEPPEGFSEEWREEYREAKRESERDKREEREERLEFVINQWNEAKSWWAKEFDQEAVMRNSNGERGNGDVAEGPPVESSEPSPPPPPPSPTSSNVPAAAEALAADAAREASEQEDDGAQLLVVTGSRIVDNNLQETPVAVSAISAPDATGAVVEVKLADVLSEQPYLAALENAATAERLKVLAEQEIIYGSVPAFYLDVAEWFRLKGSPELSRELLLSALDLASSDDETALIVAFRLEREGDYDTAIALLERLAAKIDYRTQPKRTLALALVARARSSTGPGRLEDFQRAFELLGEVVLAPTDARYRGMETVALMELNSLIPLIEAEGGSWSFDERLVARLDTDVRIVIEWTSADADLDLWLTEPSGERASYSNQRTALGGKVSDDMTNGYGPEEYVIKQAYDGDYEVRVQGFRGDRINPNGPGRVMVRLIRNFARDDHAEQLIDTEVGFDRSNQSENDRAIATLSVGG